MKHLKVKVLSRVAAVAMTALGTIGSWTGFAAPAGASGDVCVSVHGTNRVAKGASQCSSDTTSKAVAVNGSEAVGVLEAQAVAVNNGRAVSLAGGQAVAVNGGFALALSDSHAVAVNGCALFVSDGRGHHCHG